MLLMSKRTPSFEPWHVFTACRCPSLANGYPPSNPATFSGGRKCNLCAPLFGILGSSYSSSEYTVLAPHSTTLRERVFPLSTHPSRRSQCIIEKKPVYRCVKIFRNFNDRHDLIPERWGQLSP